jgi:hypothetical protein
MNPTNRRVILEHVQVAKTAACRMRSFYKSGSLTDEGYERLRALDQCISNVESYFFNQPDDEADKHPLVWAIENMLQNNPDVAAEDIKKFLQDVYYVKNQVFEVVLDGFDGSSDETDDRVKWISAPSSAAVLSYCNTIGFAYPVRNISIVESTVHGIDLNLDKMGKVVL